MLSKRTQIGIVSLLLLGLAIGLWLFLPRNSEYLNIQGALLKVGLVMGAVWMAYPQLAMLPVWLAIMTIGSVLIILLFKKAAIVLIPLLILIWLLRPRPPKKRKSFNRESSSSAR